MGTATRSTELTSYSPQPRTPSSQSVNSSRAAEWPCTPPFEAFVGDSLSSELLAVDAQHRPLGCLLGNSIRPKEANKSTTVRLSCCQEEVWPWFGSLREAPHGPAATGVLWHAGTHREGLEEATKHALKYRVAAQTWLPPAAAPCTRTWNSLPASSFPASRELQQ